MWTEKLLGKLGEKLAFDSEKVTDQEREEIISKFSQRKVLFLNWELYKKFKKFSGQ